MIIDFVVGNVNIKILKKDLDVYDLLVGGKFYVLGVKEEKNRSICFRLIYIYVGW